MGMQEVAWFQSGHGNLKFVLVVAKYLLTVTMQEHGIDGAENTIQERLLLLLFQFVGQGNLQAFDDRGNTSLLLNELGAARCEGGQRHEGLLAARHTLVILGRVILQVMGVETELLQGFTHGVWANDVLEHHAANVLDLLVIFVHVQCRHHSIHAVGSADGFDVVLAPGQSVKELQTTLHDLRSFLVCD